jgi:hypothetical protein
MECAGSMSAHPYHPRHSPNGYDTTQVTVLKSLAGRHTYFAKNPYAYSHLLATLRAIANSTIAIPASTSTCGHNSEIG